MFVVDTPLLRVPFLLPPFSRDVWLLLLPLPFIITHLQPTLTHLTESFH
jgi:hypothetical protein